MQETQSPACGNCKGPACMNYAFMNEEVDEAENDKC